MPTDIDQLFNELWPLLISFYPFCSQMTERSNKFVRAYKQKCWATLYTFAITTQWLCGQSLIVLLFALSSLNAIRISLNQSWSQCLCLTSESIRSGNCETFVSSCATTSRSSNDNRTNKTLPAWCVCPDFKPKGSMTTEISSTSSTTFFQCRTTAILLGTVGQRSFDQQHHVQHVHSANGFCFFCVYYAL